MSENPLHIIHSLIQKGVLPKSIPTKKVVAIIGGKMHRAKLYKKEFRMALGARRKGKGLHFEFDTLKVIEYKLNREYLNKEGKESRQIL